MEIITGYNFIYTAVIYIYTHIYPIKTHGIYTYMDVCACIPHVCKIHIGFYIYMNTLIRE